MLQPYKLAQHTSRFLRPGAVDYFLCKPEAILFADLNAVTSGSDVAKPCRVTRRVVRSGVMDGQCLYFRVIFDEEISGWVIFSTPERGPSIASLRTAETTPKLSRQVKTAFGDCPAM